MTFLKDLFMSPQDKVREQEKAMRNARSKARAALNREKRAIAKSERKADELRQRAVDCERKGRSDQAKQAVRQFVQIDRQVNARGMAVGNMEFAFDQIQMKSNYEDFVRGMNVFTEFEALAHDGLDPETVRSKIEEIFQQNADVIEPWMEAFQTEAIDTGSSARMSSEEVDAYQRVLADAAGDIQTEDVELAGTDFEKIERELEGKMQQARN